MALEIDNYPFLRQLGLAEDNLGTFAGEWIGSGPSVDMINPATGGVIARVKTATDQDYEAVMACAESAREWWAAYPAPKRGEIIRQIGLALRAKCDALGRLVSLCMGKILAEGVGEVVEYIDICDYAVGLSRSYNGKIVQSERANHAMYETFSPLGIIGIISAFNFPIAVCGWNAAIAQAVGDVSVWKGATSTALVTVATTRIITDVLKANDIPLGVFTCVTGPGSTIGEKMLHDDRLKLVSFTGSTEVGRHVATVVSSRFGRVISELGGNNGVVAMPDCDVDLLVQSCLFAAVGTCGQRCTSLRRLIVHEEIYDEVKQKLLRAYRSLASRVGDPLNANTLISPLHTRQAVTDYIEGVARCQTEGGLMLCGGSAIERPGFFVQPTVFEVQHDLPCVRQELFAPVLYLIKFSGDIHEGIRINNEVPQGLASSLFTRRLDNVMAWVGHAGSDCGIVNVNIPTSGAEIGGQFGGNKETGGGREAGGEAWKQYCLLHSVTINYGSELPLAQGIHFG